MLLLLKILFFQTWKNSWNNNTIILIIYMKNQNMYCYLIINIFIKIYISKSTLKVILKIIIQLLK